MEGIMGMGPGAAREALRAGSISVCVVGVGRIGLPTALSFAEKGLPVTGLDINAPLVDRLNAGDYPLKDEPHFGRILGHALAERKFSATTDARSCIPASDVVLLSLPTPMDDANVPDYSALLDVGAQLHGLLREGSIVVVESTVEPGFVEGDLARSIEGDGSRLKAGETFGLGACPENANPGEIYEYTNTRPRLVGATTPHTASIISEVYQHVFPVRTVMLGDCKTANAVKLAGNVFRDINIAFVNEMSVLFERLGIDTYRVFEAAEAKKKFVAHYPGAGVGGPCIPVNSYQLLNLARSASVRLGMVEAARRANESMPAHVVGLVRCALEGAGGKLSGSTVLVLGITYKPDVKDIQLAPAGPVIEGLRREGASVLVYDPFFCGEEAFGTTCADSAYAKADCAVLITDHTEFKSLDLARLASCLGSRLLVDARGAVSKEAAEKAGLILCGLGR
ncbi:MAG: nucleotide sugar dehydrogenase [Nitrosopumilus sp.]|nr:nucleotide sugar dehydrogenase [Nitrosopumilus sp.]